MKKKIILILSASLFVPFLSAAYSPYFALSGDYVYTIVESNGYSSFSPSVAIAPLSYSYRNFTLSFPLSFSYVTHSSEQYGLSIPQFYKNGIGLDFNYRLNRLYLGLGLSLGYEDYIEENSLLAFFEVEAYPMFYISKYLRLALPLSYTYTLEGSEVALSVSLRIGGEE